MSDAYAWHGGDALWPNTETILSKESIDVIARASRRADADNCMAEEAVAALRKSGYFGAPVPSSLQGGGASAVACCALQRRLGAADPALAIAVNMHLFSVGIMVEHWQRTRDVSGFLLEAIATQNRIVASAFAEPGLGGSLLRSYVTAKPAPGGYLLSGRKTPCSLAERSDLVCFQAEVHERGREDLIVALLPTATAGVRIEKTWDTLGMRASESDSLIFDNVFLSDKLVFHRTTPGFDDDPVFAAGLIWFCATTTSTYLGVARAVMAEVRGQLARAQLLRLATTRGKLPSVQETMGELSARLLTMEVACFGLATALSVRTLDARSLLPYALSLKQSAIEACVGSVESAMELLGAQSYARQGDLARAWRDVQAMRFHPPTRGATRQILGRWCFDLPLNFDLAARGVHLEQA